VKVGVASTLAAFLVSSFGLANTYTVTTTADSGAGSLRQAILDANGNPGADTIAFNITGSGVQTISVATALPTITEAVTINGYSQSGASANTNAPNQGTNAVIMIEIDGTNAGAFGSGLISTTAAVTVRGLAINRCATGAGIFIGAGGNGSVIAGNFLGTDPTGSSRPAAQYYGVEIEGATGVVVGGANPADRNLISGNDFAQVFVGDSGGPNTVVKGNLIGTNAAGTGPVTGMFDYAQVYVRVGTGVVVGGPTAAERNVISGSLGTGNATAGVGIGYTIGGTGAQATIQGNYIGTDVTGTLPIPNGYGLSLPDSNCIVLGNVIAGSTLQGIISEGGANEIIQGNFIGTDETATLDLGNGGGGMAIGGNNWTIGGTGPGEGNVIAHNGPPYGGIANGESTGANIRANRIFDNRPLGIDLYVGGASGVTPNDAGDADTGPNNGQNYPMITTVTPGGSTTNIQGLLNSTASTVFDIDLFSTAACIPFPQAYLQGENYLGTFQVTTDGSGNATFSHDVPFVLQPGQLVTATATDPNGNTSEFSQRILFIVSPGSGPPAGGTNAGLNGMLFENGATVTVGGVAATGVVFNSPANLNAVMPARPAGSLNDVTISNPSGLAGTLRNGWIADFGDTPGSQQFYYYITRLVANQITVGCGSGNYCPDADVTRQQMAVFLLKGKHGLCYAPPACTPGFFDDVPCPSTYAAWIQALATEGITGGCGGNSYCPTNPVRRDQMAVFLLKSKYGPTYTPPACTPPGAFPDVPCPGTFTNWVEELANESIAAGCGGGNFCPTNPNNRGQMAVFITKTFNLQ
jgi:hypothetical protein